MSRSRVEFEEREHYREQPRRAVAREYDDVELRVRERSRERVNDRLPYFMREENRRPEPGQLVLRQREVETIERPRPRSPSPVRVTQRIVQRARSVSPAQRRVEEEVRFQRVVREPSRGPTERIRIVQPRSRSPSPEVRDRIRIVEREKERAPSPAPAPQPPTPKVIKGPIIEREVITHYRDIDHGVVAAPRPPSPPPARHNRDTEIDIYTSRNQTEVDIHRHGRGRSVSRERTSRRALQTWDDDVVVQSDRRQLQVDIEHWRSTSRGRRAHSAAPPAIDYDDEALEITRKIDSRGRMGEAWNGITKDWSIIDVPPGTERVRLDGAGGASAEVTWQKYSGVRRTKFIPERDDKSSAVSSSTSLSELRAPAERERRLSVHVVDNDRAVSRERNVDVEKVTDRRITIRGSTPPPRNRSETWTEITKDLVCREAIEQLNYEYEETDYFYYIVEYLSYEDVVRLVNLSDRIRAARKERAREIAYEREWRDDWDHRNHHHHRRRRYSVDYEDDRVVEREITYETRHPGRGYRH
ncbi:hypothetical protein MYCTH_2076744 [Thermothelomyces thermophilus ATCC 42464]|uniref:DUF8035 domain-containing protein n=1 Tax=Thermothelomyces thermophilus (strain ATCC 42464 / BCRC 31852 / DSM 1799) TaxID=573729 RepID=G2Q603_THET4|nr:uncharacterized protein MYCTH_2076744 [Thermothelomyces thermophilus ATCC 42464]AEO54680.1 hypothetical protein MYCTH_2076744 [Thermothelomyces thermophilus ATCC 42464]